MDNVDGGVNAGYLFTYDMSNVISSNIGENLGLVGSASLMMAPGLQMPYADVGVTLGLSTPASALRGSYVSIHDIFPSDTKEEVVEKIA